MGLQGQFTLHGLSQDHAGNEQAVDLIGSLEDPVDPLVPVKSLGRIIADKAVAAMDLHHLVNSSGQHLAAEDLGDAALGGIFLDPFLVFLVIIGNTLFDGLKLSVKKSRQAIHQGFRGKNIDVEIGDLLGDRPEAADLAFELDALIGILDTNTEGHLGRAGNACAKFEATYVEDVEGDLVALADLTEQVFDRHLAVVEDDLGRG